MTEYKGNDKNENDLAADATGNEIAGMDFLTGLPNRAAIFEELEKELKNPSGNGGIILADLDDFRGINSNYGHWYGDYILKLTADTIQQYAGSSGKAGRTGGDEFLIIFPGMDKESVEKEAEGMMKCFEKISQGEKIERPVTLSAGLAMYPFSGRDVGSVYGKAYNAVRKIKLAGKNAYSLYRNVDKISPVRQAPEIKYNPEISIEENFQRMISMWKNGERDLHEGLQSFIRMAGEFLGCDRASILEADVVGNNLYCCYEWCQKESMVPERNQYLMYGKKVVKRFLEYFSEQEPMIVSADVDQEDLTDMYRFSLKKKNARAAAHFAVFKEDVLVYLFRFENYGHPREWTDEQLMFIRKFAEDLKLLILEKRDQSRVELFMDRYVNYDKLTKIPTYQKFQKDARDFILMHPGEEFAIVYSDFKNFKYVNDAFGYAVGDYVLCTFADIIKEGSEEKVICRISADSFAGIFISHSHEEIIAMVEKKNELLKIKLREEYPGMNITFADGIYFYDGGAPLADVIDNANFARRIAKKNPEGGITVFDEDMKKKMQQESLMLNSLDKALVNGEFQVYYQPKISLETEKIVGAEALIRWERADGTIIYPDQFIPFCESNGLITKLDLFVLEQTCGLLHEWQETGQELITISVNLSRYDCLKQRFYETVTEIVDSYDIPHQYLEFEVTESVFLGDISELSRFLNRLQDTGFLVSIDDFGSGYSALNVLPEIPANFIKFDRVFLQNEDRNKRQTLLKYLVRMVKHLGFRTLCEGIEEAEQAVFCKSIGCEQAQGFLFSKPVNLETFKKIVEDRK